MAELVIEIPEELKDDVERISKIELSLAVSRFLKEKLERMARLEKILSKSKLSEKKAKEIADEISVSLSKEYDRLYMASRR